MVLVALKFRLRVARYYLVSLGYVRGRLVTRCTYGC